MFKQATDAKPQFVILVVFTLETKVYDGVHHGQFLFARPAYLLTINVNIEADHP